MLLILHSSWRRCMNHRLLRRRLLIGNWLWYSVVRRVRDGDMTWADWLHWLELSLRLGISDVSSNRLNRGMLAADGSMAQRSNGWQIFALGSHIGFYLRHGHGHGHERSRGHDGVALGLLQTSFDVAQLSKEIEVEVVVRLNSRCPSRFGIREDISNGIISCRLWCRHHNSRVLFRLNKCSRVGKNGHGGEATLRRLSRFFLGGDLFISLGRGLDYLGLRLELPGCRA